MPENGVPTAQDFTGTGFEQASGVANVQQQASQIKVDDASLRQQAEAQYKPTYEAEQRSLSTQLTQLIKAQTDDSELLNKQYQQSVNTMMSKLAKRGLNTGATPDATVAALDKFRNEVMTQRQAVYGAQREGVQRLSDTLKGNYELNVQARMAANRSSALSSLNDFLSLISQLQNASFGDYANYLMNSMDIYNQRLQTDMQKMELDIQNAKNNRSSSGGGGGRRSSGGYGTTTTTGTGTTNGLGTDYFSGGGNPARTASNAFATSGVGGALSALKPGKTAGSNVRLTSGGGGRRIAVTK